MDAEGRGREGRMTIYLAEDDGELRRTLALLLRKDGHAVVESGSGIELLTDLVWERLYARHPSDEVLVVTDVRMPDRDGLAILRTLKERGEAARAVVMTGFADAALKDEARRLGAMAVFDKPFDLDDLRTFVRELGAAARSPSQ